jgi:parvulin-like peptidyl-prolyl isomerase
LSIFVLGLLAGGTFIWGVYKLDWQGDLINKVLEVVPLPSAKVNDQFISYPDYVRTLTAAEIFYAKQKENGMPKIPNTDEIKALVMDRLVSDVLVYNLAQRYKINVSSEDINAKLEEVIQNKGSQEEAEKFLRTNYNFSLEDYKKYFIKPNLYYSKTNEAIIDDEAVNGEAKKKIQEALSKLRNGEDFVKASAAYSEDAKAQEAAAQENFLRGELPKDIEDLLFSSKVGDYTDILNLPDKFVIFKLINKDEDKGVLTLQRILVKIKTIEDLIKIEKEKAQIKIYAY